MTKKSNELLNLDDELEPFYKFFSENNFIEALSVLNNLEKNFQNNDFLYTLGGDCYSELKQYDLAINCYDEAIKLNTLNAKAYNNKANALEKIHKFDEAIICAESAININPVFSLAFFNLGVNAMHQRLFDLSKKSFDMAIKLEPNFAKYQFAKSNLLLLIGDYKNGWKLFESRWKLDKLFSPKLKTKLPIWTGSKHVRLLVWGEQGVGDQIMYSALIPDLINKCPDVSVMVDPRLVNLLNRSLGNLCTFYPDNEDLPFNYDEHIAIGSLCQYLRNEEKDFENSRYGFLKDDNIKTSNFRKDILALKPEYNKLCGISWKSSSSTGVLDKILLKDFVQMLDLKGYIFVNLQYGDTENEIKEVKDELGIDIISYQKVDNFNDIDGLTSLIQACDTVVSVDNITCQLTGSLGKETHIILNHNSWWGWMVNRTDSPWYDSVKLYRRDFNESLSSVLKKIKRNIL